MGSNPSLILTPTDLADWSKAEVDHLIHDWALWARGDQLPPDHPQTSNPHSPDWEVWTILAGRGYGKTRIGAEQVLRWVDQGYRRIHILAPTTADTRDVVVEGDSGIMNIAHPRKRPRYEPSKRKLTFPNGAIALLFSAEEPERLRGPQCEALWADEIAAWQYPQETWDQAMFGLRLGRHPQVVISTTPKPIPLIRWLVEQSKKDPKKYVITKGSTYDNKANLASTFFSQVASYEGTRLGRQELHAELIDPREGGIVKESWFGRYPHDLDLPVFEHILQSYDTAFTEKTQDRKTKDPDPSACSSWGVFKLTPQLRKALKLPDVTPFEYGVLLLDAWDDHLGYPELRAKAEREYRDSYYGPKGDQRRADTVLIEDKGSGISLRQDLQLVVPARPYNPGRADKTERLHSVSNIIKRGAVFIPESRTHQGEFSKWAKKPMEEWCCFPQVVNDDYTDTLTQALSYIKDLGYLVMDIPYEEEEPEVKKKSSNPYGQ